MNIFTAGTKAEASKINENFQEVLDKYLLTLTADEDIAKYDAVAFVKSAVDLIASADDVTQNLDDAEFDLKPTNNKACQSFVIGAGLNYLNSITMKFRWGGGWSAHTDTVYWELYLADANDKPSGSAIASGSSNYNYSGEATFTLNFTINQSVTAGQKYCVVVWQSDHGNEGKYIRYKNSDVYVGGKASISTDGGSSWINQAYDFYIVTNAKRVSTAGRIVKASALANDYKSNQYIGIATEAISRDASGDIQIFGKITNASWNFSSILATDNEPKIYLGNTAGSISISAGTQTRKIGKALASDTILLIPSFFS